MPTVLVSDALADAGLEILEQARGLEVVNRPGLSPEELLEAIQSADGLVIRSGTKVTADVLAAAKNLKIDGPRRHRRRQRRRSPRRAERGVVVVNTPEGNNITTAEHAIALMVSLARHIPAGDRLDEGGKWEKKKFQGMELYNRTLGVDRAPATSAASSCLARGPRHEGDRARSLHHAPRPPRSSTSSWSRSTSCFERADVVTVHVPKTKETTGLLRRDVRQDAKKGV